MTKPITHREIARALNCGQSFATRAEAIEIQLDAAERRGWIAALEWISSGKCYSSSIVQKLAELKAEENKR